MTKDTRPRYPGTCPECKKTFHATKSLAMIEFGMNDFGGGKCVYCNTHIHLTFRPETQDFEAEHYETYLEKLKIERNWPPKT